MSDADRSALAARQADALLALLANGAAPPGLDERQLRTCAESLFRKRRATLAQAWPALVKELGAEFRPRFASFAAAVPMPADGGPFADGRAFAAWLADRGQLSDVARRLALQVDVRWRRSATGLRPRRWPCVRLAKLSGWRCAFAAAWNHPFRR